MRFRLFVIMFSTCLLTVQASLCQEEIYFRKLFPSGMELVLTETKFSKMGKLRYQEKRGDCGFQDLDMPYEMSRFDLMCSSTDGTNIVWSTEWGLSALFMGFASGYGGNIPKGIRVWDVAELDDEIIVVYSVQASLRADVQKRGRGGRWENANTFALGDFSLSYASVKVTALPDEVKVGISQWSEQDARDKQTSVLAISKSGIRACPMMGIQDQD